MLELLCKSRKSLNQQCSKKTLRHTPRLQQIQNLIFRPLSFNGIIHVTTLSGNFQVYETALISLKSILVQSFHTPHHPPSHQKKQKHIIFIEVYSRIYCTHIYPKPVLYFVSLDMYIHEKNKEIQAISQGVHTHTNGQNE